MQYLKINRVYGILKTKVDSVIMLYGNEVIHMKCKDLLKNLEYECVRGSVDVEVTEVYKDFVVLQDRKTGTPYAMDDETVKIGRAHV